MRNFLRRRAGRHRDTADVVLRGAELPDVVPHVPAGGGSAWEDSATRGRFDHYRTGTRLLAAGATALAILVGVAHLSVSRGDAQLARHGVRTAGTVVDGDWASGKLSQDWVAVRYSAGHRELVGTLHGPNPDDYDKGAHVTVIYSREHPAHFRTPEYANHSNLVDSLVLTAPAVFAVMLWIGVAVALARARRWRRLLSAGPWQRWHAQQGEIAYGNSTVVVLGLTGHTADGRTVGATVRFADGWKPSTSSFSVPADGTVLYRPGGGRRGVITAAGVARPFEVLLPRSPRQERRWQRGLVQQQPHDNIDALAVR